VLWPVASIKWNFLHSLLTLSHNSFVGVILRVVDMDIAATKDVLVVIK
jgi:hypothetical protein